MKKILEKESFKLSELNVYSYFFDIKIKGKKRLKIVLTPNENAYVLDTFENIGIPFEKSLFLVDFIKEYLLESLPKKEEITDAAVLTFINIIKFGTGVVLEIEVAKQFLEGFLKEA